MNTPKPITTNDFTTSMDTSNLTPEQEQNLLDIAQFFKSQLSNERISP